MSASRSRVGFLVPSANAVFERDCRRAFPTTADYYVARVACANDSAEELAGLARRSPEAALTLRDAAVEALVFACTSGSMLEGHAYDDALLAELESVTGLPATSTARAVVAALESVEARRVAVLTPYEKWLDERVRTYLAESDIAVVSAYGFGLPDPRVHEQLEPEQVAERALALCTPGVEALLISCTSFRGMEAAEIVRTELGVPVVSSNEASLWAGLRLARGGGESFDGFIRGAGGDA